MSKNNNPYVRGNYHLAFAYMQKKQVITRDELMKFFMTLKTHKGVAVDEKAAAASTSVLLGPREKDSKHGDCRGNFSAQGHIYFMEVLKKVKGESKRFRLRYRKVALEPRKRPVSDKPVKGKKAVKTVKAVKPVKTVKAPVAKKTAKKTVKKTVKAVKPVKAPVAPVVETPVAVVDAPVVETPVAPVAVEETVQG